ncbi:IPT/TIG domain-containing protein [Ensifer adhaerens]|uniref:IPT/TIG domain-containing protein n=1 Tax=Ensifer adhaerens TaxID=106592 RepID=UPI001AEE6578
MFNSLPFAAVFLSVALPTMILSILRSRFRMLCALRMLVVAVAVTCGSVGGATAAVSTISSVSPASGSPTGGTSVTIPGTGLAGATTVKFGSVPAASFTVNSDTQITAVAPPGTAGPVDIVVTTGSGSVTLPNGFSYLVVPPGAPTIGTVTPLDPEGAFVYFTPPADTGGGAVTEYIVTSSPHGKIGVGTQSPIAVHGLWSGMPYTFTVAAKNAAGTGLTSAPSQAVTPGDEQFGNTGGLQFHHTGCMHGDTVWRADVPFRGDLHDQCGRSGQRGLSSGADGLAIIPCQSGPTRSADYRHGNTARSGRGLCLFHAAGRHWRRGGH